MFADVRAQTKQDRDHWLSEKDNVQTSLMSKKQGDAQEAYRANEKARLLMDTTQNNIQDMRTQTQNYFANRTMKLQDEQRWLSQIEEV